MNPSSFECLREYTSFKISTEPLSWRAALAVTVAVTEDVTVVVTVAVTVAVTV